MWHICLLKTAFKNQPAAVNEFHQLTPFPAPVSDITAIQPCDSAVQCVQVTGKQLEHCTTTGQIVRVINKASSRWKLFHTCHFGKCKKHRLLQQLDLFQLSLTTFEERCLQPLGKSQGAL